MNIEQLREFCIAKKASTEGFPFDQHTLVFKVLGKMFALFPLEKWEKGEPSMMLKCDPDYTTELREKYESIYAGPYVSNKHWNTVKLNNGELSNKFVLELIDHSYDMVVKGMTKKMRESLKQY